MLLEKCLSGFNALKILDGTLIIQKKFQFMIDADPVHWLANNDHR